MLNNIKLYKGDCLEIMRDIPDKSIDMILCDLPYGTTACKWDTVIPFEPLWEQYNRIIKGNGAIVLFGSEPFSSALRMSNIENYRYDWVWNKKLAGNGILSNIHPLKIHENIMIFYKDLNDIKDNTQNYKTIRDYFFDERKKTNLTYKQLNELMGVASNGGGMASNILSAYKKGWTFPTREKYELLQTTDICKMPYDEIKSIYDKETLNINNFTYNAQLTKGKMRTKMGLKTSEINGGNGYSEEVVNDTYKPVSILEFSSAGLRKGKLHPTQKPIDLLEYLIKTYTNENAVVLDNTMGSGSTGVACINTNRKFIGIEMDDTYFEIAKERIQNTYNELKIN